MRKLFLPLCLILAGILFFAPSYGQILSIDPIFPTIEDTVTVLYDATEGNSALVGVSPVYAHAGLITDQSTSPTDWKHVQGNWGTPDPKVLMEDLGNNVHKLRYHIRSYYSVPPGENVEELSFVFRNADGSVVGRSADGSDIYYPVYQAGALEVAFLSPEPGRIYEVNDMLTIQAAASDSSTLSLFIDGSLSTQTYGKSISYSQTLTAPGTFQIKLRADNGSTVKEDSLLYTVRGNVSVQNPSPGIQPGINYLNDTTVVLALYAPRKAFVYVLGDFNDWLPNSAYFMHLSTDSSLWWLEISGLVPEEEYGFQYWVDGAIKIGDPYCDKVLDPWNDPFIPALTYPNLKSYPTGKTTDIVSVLQTAQTPYVWQSTNYQRPEQENLVVYELLVRDFVARHDYQTLIDSLDYLSRLGVNAIELMPVYEFEGNESWGYNPSYLFAVDKYYGTKDALKAFVDSCHARGIAVILDMVLNHHFGQSPLVRLYWDGANNKPAPDNPWFNPDATHPFNVGYDFNHESPQTKAYADRVLRYWVEEFRFDGFRMDLSKGFTQTNNPNDVGAWGQYDASRVAILERMADSLWAVDEGVYFILEHLSENSEEKALADYGMMLWGNLNHNYAEASMGYLPQSNFSWISYQNRNWQAPHVVGYMESHDEERMMYKNKAFGNASGNYSTQNLVTGLERVEMCAAFFIPIPGPKMIWQFGELGYDYSIDFNGRVGNKPIRWDYRDQPNRYRLYTIFAALNELKTTYPVFQTDDFSIETNGAFKHLHLNDSSMNVTIVGNFDVSFVTGSPSFQHIGWWYDYFTGDSIEVASLSSQLGLAPGEYHVYTDVKLSSPSLTVAIESDSDSWGLTAFPNPFQAEITLEFRMPQAGGIYLEVLNSFGQKVASLSQGEKKAAGIQRFTWNGRTDEGQTVVSGVYFVRLRMGHHQEIRKIILNQ